MGDVIILSDYMKGIRDNPRDKSMLFIEYDSPYGGRISESLELSQVMVYEGKGNDMDLYPDYEATMAYVASLITSGKPILIADLDGRKIGRTIDTTMVADISLI
jgi:hypothetical protein|tara:strand:+ start:10461 stop:10772 length:312 start_codon:yes stop_codon:yes gene_type:complete